jgi:hypothetical protein
MCEVETNLSGSGRSMFGLLVNKEMDSQTIIGRAYGLTSLTISATNLGLGVKKLVN